MIVLKFVLGWILIGLLFNVIVEGVPDPRKKLCRWRKRVMTYDLIMGPIGVVWYCIVAIKKISKG